MLNLQLLMGSSRHCKRFNFLYMGLLYFSKILNLFFWLRPYWMGFFLNIYHDFLRILYMIFGVKAKVSAFERFIFLEFDFQFFSHYDSTDTWQRKWNLWWLIRPYVTKNNTFSVNSDNVLQTCQRVWTTTTGSWETLG